MENTQQKKEFRIRTVREVLDEVANREAKKQAKEKDEDKPASARGDATPDIQISNLFYFIHY